MKTLLIGRKLDALKNSLLDCQYIETCVLDAFNCCFGLDIFFFLSKLINVSFPPPHPKLDIGEHLSVLFLHILLINCFSDDYENLSPDYLAASQRSSKLCLLLSCCSLLLPDLKSKQVSSLLDLLCKLLNTAGSADKLVNMDEQLGILKLLTVFVNSCADKVGDRLGKLL